MAYLHDWNVMMISEVEIALSPLTLSSYLGAGGRENE
jgi:hypothetical protein